MKNFFLIFNFLIVLQFTHAQSLIAVQNGGNPTFYADLGDAIDNAVAGDTLYIPGKSYSLNKTIDKRIHLVGTGIDPNSTLATGITSISSPNTNEPQLYLGENADGGSMTGIYFTSGPLWNLITVDGAIVSNYFISRCFFNRNVDGNFSNSLFSQNIFYRVYINADNSNSIFSNNIILERFNSFDYISIFNNLFLVGGFSGNDGDFTINNCLVENNIWHPLFSFENITSNYNILRNNLNEDNGTTGTNTRSGNFPGSFNLATIFVSYSGSINDATSFTGNFQLPDASPYKNAGTDGTDIGIYGGRFPWKDGSAPFNPQIILKNILGNTDENGNIQAEIQVEAQKN